jgi:hypothetical protein
MLATPPFWQAGEGRFPRCKQTPRRIQERISACTTDAMGDSSVEMICLAAAGHTRGDHYDFHCWTVGHCYSVLFIDASRLQPLHSLLIPHASIFLLTPTFGVYCWRRRRRGWGRLRRRRNLLMGTELVESPQFSDGCDLPNPPFVIVWTVVGHAAPPARLARLCVTMKLP